MELLVERPHHFKYFFGYDPDLEEIDIIYGIVERYDMRYFPDIEFDRDWIDRNSRYYTIKYVRTDENNDTAHERMYVDLKNYMNQFNDPEKTPISKIEFINAYPNKKIIFDPGVFKVMSDYCKDIRIDIGKSYFRMEETEYKELSRLYIDSGNLLIDGNVTIKTQIFKVYISNIENYNKTEYNAHFNVLATEIRISELLKVYSTVKVKFLCEVKSKRAYRNSACRISDIEFYGSEMSKEDYKEERLKIQGFQRCSLIYLTINPDVRYPSILHVDKLEHFGLFELEYTISKHSAEGSIITIGDVARVSLYSISFEVDDGTFDDGNLTNVDLVKLLPCDVGFVRKVSITDCDIINHDKHSLINLVHVMKSNIKFLKISDCSMTSGTSFYKADEDVALEKLSYTGCTFENDVDVEIKNATYISLNGNDFDLKGGSLSLIDCTYLVLSENTIRGKNLSLKGNQRRISIHDNEIIFDTFEAICTYVPNADEEKLTYNAVFSNSTLYFKKSFTIDGFGCRLIDGLLKCPLITINSDVVSKFNGTMFTNDADFSDIVFNIISPFFITSTFVRGDDAPLLNLIFNIFCKDDSYLNKFNIENGNIFKGNLGIDINTNVPFKGNFNNNAISVKYADDFIGYKSYVTFYDANAYIINNSEKKCECKRLNKVDDNGCYKHEIIVRE